MKKSGFTLAELVITLSIVGIAAALVAPALSNLVPDKNKVRVLKYHAMIGNTIDELYNTQFDGDKGYRAPFTQQNGDFSCEGLACIVGFDAMFRERVIDNISDGSSWTMAGDAVNGYTITIDIDSNKPAKTFTAADTKNINTHSFRIDKYGDVTGNDPLTRAYLRNPLNMNDRKADYEAAKRL